MIKKILIYGPSLILVVVALFFIVTTAPSIRYWVDDFCSSALLRNNGYIGAQIAWWNSWTGRYSFVAFLDIFELMGTWSVRILPVFLLVGLIAALTPAISFMLASLFTILIFINSPNIIQSFYWQSGSLTYTIPFIFFNLIITFLVFAKRRRLYIPAFILAFIGGGFSESFALAQGIVLLLLLLVLGGTRRKIVLMALLGTLVSMVFMALAPGNSIRQESVTQPESMMFVFKSTILGTKWYLLRLIGIKTFVYSLIFLFSGVFIFGKDYKLKSSQVATIIFFSCLGVIFSTSAVIASGFYSMSILPPERTLFVAVYMILFSFLVFSFALKSYLQTEFLLKYKKWIFWGVVMINIAASAFLVKTITKDWGIVRLEIQEYAREVDKTENLLFASRGSSEVQIKNIKSVGGLDNFTDNKGWVASCLAGYYEVERVKIVE